MNVCEASDTRLRHEFHSARFSPFSVLVLRQAHSPWAQSDCFAFLARHGRHVVAGISLPPNAFLATAQARIILRELIRSIFNRHINLVAGVPECIFQNTDTNAVCCYSHKSDLHTVPSIPSTGVPGRSSRLICVDQPSLYSLRISYPYFAIFINPKVKTYHVNREYQISIQQCPTSSSYSGILPWVSFP